MNRKYFKYFLLLSFFFLLFSLIKIDYIVFPETINIYYFLASIFVLVMHHLTVAYSWKELLCLYGYNINIIDGISSYGLSNLGKYIPGKIWASFGEITYIKEKYSYPIIDTFKVSVTWQIISLWSGLSLGLISLYFLNISKIAAYFILLFWVILTFFTFTKYSHSIYNYIICKVFKKQLALNQINIKKTLKIIPLFFLSWIVLGICYYLFLNSFNYKFSIFIGLCFILSVNAGYIIFLLPGGLGIREGIIISYLIASGIDIQLATNISVYSRLWFIFGEILIFIIAFILEKKQKYLNK